MAPRRRCPICGSKQWHKEPSSGLITCSEGHVLQNYRNETREVTELGPHALRKRTLRSTRKKKERESKADPRLYHGDRARYHYFQCLQLILRMQIAALTRLWGLPPEFEIICRDVWALHLSLLPDPPPAEPLLAAGEKGHGITMQRKLPVRGTSPRLDVDNEEFSGENPDALADSGSSSSSSDEDDPEMVELMRQVSDTSSDEDEDDEGGEQKKVPATRTKTRSFHKTYEMPAGNVAVLVVTCWTLRLPVTYMDFVRLVEAYELPYLDPIRLLPDSMVLHLTKQTKKALSPEHAPTVVAVHGLASRLARLMYVNYQVHTPEMNAPPTLWRAVRALSGNTTLYMMTKKVARILSVPLTLHRSLTSPLHRVKKKDPTWHKYDSAVPEVSLIATVIVVLKMVYGLDGTPRVPEKRNDPACALPRLDEFLEQLGELDEKAEEHYRFSATSQMSALDMDDNALDDYLAFCEHALLPREPRSSERNVAMEFFPLGTRESEKRIGRPAADVSEPVALPATIPVGAGSNSNDKRLLPGERFAIYNTMDALGSLPVQYETVVKRSAKWCGVHDDYVAGVVERFERRLLRWWNNTKRMEMGEEAVESQSDDGGE